MTLLLSNKEIETLLTMPESLAALEAAYKDIAEGNAIPGTRADNVGRNNVPDALYQLKMMGSVVESLGVGAIRINSDILTWPTQSGTRRRVKAPLAPNDRWTGLVLLFSAHTGEPLAIMPDGVIQLTRVAATTALGMKHMARENSKTVGLIGAGEQARSHVLAAAAVRGIEEVRVYSPTKSRRDAFCQELQGKTGIRMISAENSRNAVENADVVICATNALDTVFFKDWIEPGMHITSIQDKGASEIEPAAILAADVVAVHERGNMSHGYITKTKNVVMPDQGEDLTMIPELEAVMKSPTLAELIAGRAPTRETDDQVTCFLNYRGLGVQFAALGYAVYHNAKNKKIGNELPTDWFTEDVCP
ncbi:MAG: ornithine cyclodeaminase family protein [Rhodospirillales bacterium]